ncbi:MAG: Cna B-type domain-containing protein [Erysipelotrichaceae bacterium]|nr:Cna B-type domain-containing protein [Erysipelotrichaceae bacterium]
MEKKNLSDGILERMRTRRGKVCKRILVGITAFATAYSLITPASTLNAEEAEENGLLPEKTSDVAEEVAAEEPVSAEEETPVIEEESQETAEPAAEDQQEVSEEPETEEAEEPAEPVEESGEEVPVPEKTEYVYEEEGVLRVTATLSDPAAVPDEAELVVTPVTADLDTYNYDAYMEALNNSSEKEYNENNTLLYDVAFVLDGEEIQPAEGTVSVTFDFLNSQLSNDLGVENEEVVEIKHLPLEDSVKEDTSIALKDITAADIKVEDVSNDTVSLSEETIEFTTDSFSVFAVNYTVDFTYDGYTYSIAGTDSILLSDLFAALGIEADAAKAASVEFTDYDLVAVEQQENDWLLTSLKAFSTNETLTVTMTDGTKYVIDVTDAQSAYTVGVYFVGYDGEDISYDGNQNFVIYTEIIDKETKEVIGWNTQRFDTNTMQPCVFNTFKTVSNEHGWDPSEPVVFDPEQHTATARLYTDNPVPTYHNVRNPGQYDTLPVSNFDGYNVFKNETNNTGTQTVIGVEKAYDKKLYINITYNPDASTAINEGDNYYVFVDVDHRTTGHTYYLDKLVSNGDSTQSISIDVWKDNNGNVLENEKFTGNEKSVTVKILKGQADLSINNAIQKTNCSVVAEGGSVKDYSVAYDERNWTNEGGNKFPDPVHDGSVHIDEYTYNVTLTKVNATNDYNFKSILGPGLYYGITAETFDQGNHIQSNFATNYYDGHSNIVEADLASSSGAIVMSDAKDYNGKLIDIGQSHSGNVLLYTDGDENCLINPRDFVTVIHEETDVLKDNFVDPIINYGENISSELLTHPATVNLSAEGQKLELDTTAFPNNATIYVDGDSIKDYLKDGKLLIKKQPDQMIVFNFDETTELSLGEFYVQYPDMSSYGSEVTTTVDGYTGNWIKSDTPTTKGPKNDAIDDLAQHLVWNCNSVTNLTLGMTTGMYLVPNDDSYTNTAQTSSGWIITGGTFHNSGGEWHSVYSELPDVDEATITAKKTLDGKTPTLIQQFEFRVEKYNGSDWNVLSSVINDGGAISYTDKVVSEGGTLSEGWNIYRISEIKKTDTTPGSYRLDETVFYAAVKYTIYGQGGSTMGVASLPRYFTAFDESSYDVNAQKATDTGLSNPVTELPPTFHNSIATDVMVQKQWSDGASRHSSDYVKIKLQQKIGDGSWSDTIRMQDSNDNWVDVNYSTDDKLLTLNESKNWYGGFNNLPVYVPTGEDMHGTVAEATYQIVEVSVNGKTPDPETIEMTLVPGPPVIGPDGIPVNVVHYEFTLKNNVRLEGEIKVKKDYSETYPEEGFTFTLNAVSAVDSEGEDITPVPMPTPNEPVTVHDSTAVSFGMIPYEKAGTYTYTVTENAPNGVTTENPTKDGITYDLTPKEITVTVSKNDDGSMTVVTNYPEGKDAVEITNTFEAKAQLEVTKTVNGNPVPNELTDEEFEFTLAKYTAEGETRDPDTDELPQTVTVSVKAGQKGTFADITYDKSGTYLYTITETQGDTEHMTYDTTPKYAKVVIADDGTATVTYGETAAATDADLTVVNTYQETTAHLEVNKEISGQALKADETFNFTMRAVSAKDNDNQDITPIPVPADLNASTTIAAGETTGDPAKFGDMTFTKAGTYTYEIQEVEPQTKTVGMTYDTTPKTATVTVTEDPQTHALSATVKYGEAESLTVTNKYELTEAEVLKVWNDNEDAKKKRPESIDVVLKADGETKETITLDAEGEWTAKVTDLPKYKEDGKTEIVYTWEEDTTGLPAGYSLKSVNKQGTVTTITNAYNDTTTKFRATKDYGNWGDAQKFTFTLSAVSAQDSEGEAITPVPMPAAGGEKAEATKTAPTAEFGEIAYTEAGTYTYKIKEDLPDGVTAENPTKDGITYDTDEHTVTVVVTKDNEGALSTDVKYDTDEQTLTVTNTFEAKAQLEVTKTVNGNPVPNELTDEEFEFTLAKYTAEGETRDPDTDELPQTVTVSVKAGQKGTFADITYDKSGTYLYTITETQGDTEHMTYDTTPKYAKVVIADDGTATVTYGETAAATDADLTVVNTYQETTATFEVTKEFNDWGKADNFTFDLKAVTENAPMPDEKTAVATKRTMKAVFETITYDKAGVYEYTITERNDGVDGVSYDITPKTVTVEVKEDETTKALSTVVSYSGKDSLIVTNTFTATFENLEVTKKLEGREWSENDKFTFELVAGESKDSDGKVIVTPMPDSTKETATKNDPTVEFDTIEFDKTGTYQYIVKEVLPDGVTEDNPVKDGITYDTEEHKVTVTVTKAKDETNALTATVEYEDEAGLIITNKYAAIGNIEVWVQKVLDGREWTNDDTFSFTISAEENTPMPAETTLEITNETKDHLKSFGSITLTKAGTYTYTVKETAGDAKGMTYDTADYTVTFNMIDDGKGHIIPESEDDKDLIQAVTITNTYVDIKVKKVDDSDKAVKGAVLAVKDSNGTIVDKWTTDGSIHEVQYLIPDATYTLTELSAPEGYEKSADIKFTTGPDGRVQVLKMVDKKTVVPNTSDTNHTAGWTASLITSMLVALAAFFMKKRYSYR